MEVQEKLSGEINQLWDIYRKRIFFEDGRVVSQRKGSNQRENKYLICGSKIFWKTGPAIKWSWIF
mgnify:CR=1 FL=1